MKLEIKNLVIGPFGQSEAFEVELFNEQIDEGVLAERIKGRIVLTKLEDEVLADFSVKAKVRTVCDRCLSEYQTEIPLGFKQEYLVYGEADDEKLFIEKGQSVDITEPLRQEIITHLPVKKICRNDCKGICTRCGQNLNEGECQCKKEKSNKSVPKKQKKDKIS